MRLRELKRILNQWKKLNWKVVHNKSHKKSFSQIWCENITKLIKRKLIIINIFNKKKNMKWRIKEHHTP